jgi:threonine aldolase
MRQAGYLAAAGIHALDNHRVHLRRDNARASEIAQLLHDQPYVKEVLPGGTNIVIFRLMGIRTVAEFIEVLASHGILAAPMSSDTVRFVFHLDITEEMMQRLRDIIVNKLSDE